MVTLLIATHNPHKVAEIQSLLGLTYRCRHLSEFSDPPAVVEDAPTFAGNAIKKAVALRDWWQRTQAGASLDYVLADDSGLEVDALNGAPGVHSARFAALGSDVSSNATDADNNAKLLRLLKGVPAEKRTARFKCVMALLPTHGTVATPELFVGACEGRIAFECRGKGGFGYDPLFLPQGYDRTFAELGAAIKNQLSHRARALEHLKAWLEARASAT